ncbi:MAG: sporulation integral membrane protein YtvI [Acutalibacteraceae bacterium]
MEQEARRNFLINTLYFLTVAAGVFIFCKFLLFCLMPFLIGAVIARLAQRPASFISSKTKIKRSTAAAGLALAIFAGAAALILFLGFKAAGAAAGLFKDINGLALELLEFFESVKGGVDSFFTSLPKELTNIAGDMYESALNRIVSSVTSYLSSAAGKAAKNAPGFLLSCVVSAAAACYIAADYPSLAKFIKGVCGKRIYENAVKIKNILINSVFRLFKGYLIIMALTFAELFIGFVVFKIKYAPLLAALIALIDILPVLGTGTVLIPWSAGELLLGNTRAGIEIAVLYVTITVVRNFAEPKIIGKQIGINPLFTLLAMFVGIKLFGLAGIFILPIALIVVIEYYKNDTVNGGN